MISKKSFKTVYLKLFHTISNKEENERDGREGTKGRSKFQKDKVVLYYKI